MQLAQQVISPIRFHSDVSLEELQREYTHVIVTTGDGDYAQQARNFRTDLSVSIKYLIPISERKANLSLGIPDIDALPWVWTICRHPDRRLCRP